MQVLLWVGITGTVQYYMAVQTPAYCTVAVGSRFVTPDTRTVVLRCAITPGWRPWCLVSGGQPIYLSF